MINNLMGTGMGNLFQSTQYGSQMSFNTNMNNIFRQFGNGDRNNNNNVYYTNQNPSSNNNQTQQGESNDNEDASAEEESEEEIQKRYIQLRNSVINELPRFKFNDYKRMSIGKEIHE